MDRNELATYLEESLKGLKDFQMASVEALHEGLYQNGRPRMLLADEVGLGKTVVARGLIARLLQERMAAGKRKPLKVTYICSNQVIAGENIRKLNPFPSTQTTRRSVSRIAYLGWAEEKPKPGQEKHLLEINTLTPATSFQLGYGIGNKWERLLIYAALCHDLKMKNRRKALVWLLKGTVRKMPQYREQLKKSLDWELREDLPEKFISTLKRRTLPLTVESVYSNIPGEKERSVYDALIDFLGSLDGNTYKKRWGGCYDLCRILRECFVDCCLPYVDADLYVLDEFQRFRDLIDESSQEEQARIARRVFRGKKDTRVLLLSATPFKAFTGQEEVDRGEDHYKDFGKVLRFLLSNEEERVGHYEHHRKALYGQILDLRSGGLDALSTFHRDEVQDVLRSVICRTERHSVSADANALIEDVWKHPDHQIPFGSGDIENFRATDRIARALIRANYPAGKPIDYCKSAAFPLSFLDRYKLKEELKKKNQANHPDVQRALLETPEAWLDFDRIDKYEWSIGEGGTGPANARLSMLLDKAVGPHGAKLLWVPPSLPYYELEDAFDGTVGFSKTLLFSSWIMVPRMVSTLISYEVEKRTVGNPETVEAAEEEPRTYFTAENKRRHPVPLIRYARRMVKGTAQLANMSNFTLLYPSQALVGIIDPVENLGVGRTLSELREIAADRIREKLHSADLSRFSRPEGESDRWYWAAPLLLDRADKGFRQIAGEWFANPGGVVSASGSESGDEPEEESGAKGEHFDLLSQCFDDPSLIGLGPMPANLAEILADLVLGSPAVVTLRSLRRIFPTENLAPQMGRAFAVADQFCSLFNKPESIAAVRLSEKHAWYWRMIADYCGSGCLQSVLDEYLHILCEQEKDSKEVIAQLLDAINLNASVINVDSLDSFQSGKPRKFRCHYAVEFGSQRVETDQGQNRAKNLRKVFNSPFRPFVLSTTSIGQEGLDFHSYCRRIVHWNLPGNPVDLEQREGRINRYKSLVIRQQLGKKYRAAIAGENLGAGEDIWKHLFRIADIEERQNTGKSELIPYWHIDPDPENGDSLKIERVIPLYPFSIDRNRLLHILKTLAIYRLAFGQPRQAELVDHLLEHKLTEEELGTVKDSLMIDLSPVRYRTIEP
ncbi:MAG: helicase-related protein [Luteolibacter sp.]